MTRTVATLPVSVATYNEIQQKLLDAGYVHLIGDGEIHMDGIALTVAKQLEIPVQGDTADQRRIRLDVSEEIQAVMDKHDVGGVVLLASRESASWRFVMPRWSGLQPDPTRGGALRLRITSKTPQAKADGESTLHMIGTVRDMARDVTELFGRIFRGADQAFRATGGSIEHERQRSMDPAGEKLE